MKHDEANDFKQALSASKFEVESDSGKDDIKTQVKVNANTDQILISEKHEQS